MLITTYSFEITTDFNGLNGKFSGFQPMVTTYSVLESNVFSHEQSTQFCCTEESVPPFIGNTPRNVSVSTYR